MTAASIARGDPTARPVMRPLTVEHLAIRSLRNLARVDVELGPRFNVLSGDNGQGKTNLLEAVYVVATSRSFRTAKLADLVDADAPPGTVASIRARVREEDTERAQSVAVRGGLRAVRVDGARPPTLAAYAVQTPVVAFHAGTMALSTGSGAERRKLLDRLSLYGSPAAIGDADAYVRAMRARQRTLEARGEAAPDLDGWEELMARHGSAVSRTRAEAAARLAPATCEAFERIGAPGSALDVRYERGSPEDLEEFRRALAASRRRDRARGSASAGPHRDDVAIRLGGRPVRGVASQGQHRAVVLALQLAEIDLVAQSRGAQPVLLLDDVSSELDAARTQSLLDALRARRGQVLLTTTRPELIDTGDSFGAGERRDFTVVRGRIERLVGRSPAGEFGR